MKVVHYDFSCPFELKNNLGTIVIENNKKFYEYCSDIFSMQNGEDGKFIFLEKDKELKFSKNGLIIFDIFNLDFNDKKIISGLYSKLNEIVEENYHFEYLKYIGEFMKIIDDIKIDSPYPYTYNEDISFNDLLKAIKVQPEKEYSSILEKLINYINVISEYTLVKLIVFVNVRNFLTQEEMKELIKHIGYCKINIVFLESIQPKRVMDEKILIIDNDLCEVIIE